MDELYDQIIKLAFTVATVVVVPLVGAILVKVLQKWGLAVSAEQRAKLEKLAQDAILATEEQATAKIKAGLAKLLPEEKLNAAITALMLKVPGITEGEAAVLVNQELPKLRAATGNFLQATTTAAGR